VAMSNVDNQNDDDERSMNPRTRLHNVYIS
jgi:hypothetical protein